ncbi:MAG: exodeoxyribonuclease III [Methanotrichaceae archaeon]|nr:exodeoxyribonuclease III [Methanotrichaceae archaeon]
MQIIRLFTWNVNGLRAICRKGFLDWLQTERPDILCIQETKLLENQVPPELKSIPNYHSFFSFSNKKGYGGVGLFTRNKPASINFRLPVDFDDEGRSIVADYGKFILFNIYFPNGKASKERLKYKFEFYDVFLSAVNNLKSQGKKIVICGDVNTAHKEIDLSRPKQNEKVSGFLPEERAWIDKLVSSGFLDTFRLFHDKGGHYSWWDLKTRARERNVGWRIDYFFVSDKLEDQVRSAFILKEVAGSDHCPVGIELIVDGRQ